MKICSIILSVLVAFSNLWGDIYGFPEDIFAKRLNSREFTEHIRREEALLSRGQTNYTSLWMLAAAHYYDGEFYRQTKQERKASFTRAKNYALLATQLHPQGYEGFHWLAVGYALWSKENGVFDSLFYADDVLNALNRTIELRPDYFDGVPWAMRALVYDLVPGWPLFGDRRKAMRNIETALRYARNKPTERTVVGIYVEILTRNGHYTRATNALTRFLSIPWNANFHVEEIKAYRDVSNSITVLRSRNYWP